MQGLSSGPVPRLLQVLSHARRSRAVETEYLDFGWSGADASYARGTCVHQANYEAVRDQISPPFNQISPPSKGTTMTRSSVPSHLVGAALVPLAALSLAGCGSGATASMTRPHTTGGKGAGVVQGPDVGLAPRRPPRRRAVRRRTASAHPHPGARAGPANLRVVYVRPASVVGV